jgi:phosphoesterase RecJ-like protein
MLNKILEKIKEYNKIIIFGHVRPDGDCIGSQMGLYYIIKESFPEKEVYVTGETSEYVSFLGKPELINDKLFKGALGISVDCPTIERLSDKRIALCDYKIKIDHHPDIEHFGDIEHVELISSCAEIIINLYLENQNNLILSKNAALPLYVGILTDTGRFKYDSVKPETFNHAALLLSKGLDLQYIDNMLSVERLDVLKLRGYVLSNFKMTKNGFAYIVLTKEIVNKFNVSYEEAANEVSTISMIESCPMWAMFLETDTEIRIRLRSRGPIVNDLAALYHGGGHPKASGCRIKSFDELDLFLNDADKWVKEYKNTQNK